MSFLKLFLRGIQLLKLKQIAKKAINLFKKIITNGHNANLLPFVCKKHTFVCKKLPFI